MKYGQHMATVSLRKLTPKIDQVMTALVVEFLSTWLQFEKADTRNQIDQVMVAYVAALAVKFLCILERSFFPQL